MSVPSSRAMGNVAKKILAWDDVPHVWLLRGQLGAGKTTLIRKVLRQLGVRKNVASPTFVLRRNYSLRKKTWSHAAHVDAYRVDQQSEYPALEVAELVDDAGCLLLVEWPERLPGIRWGRCLLVDIKHARGGAGRLLTLSLRRR